MIRIAIIGTGGMAGAHAKLFGEVKGCRVTACCDLVAGKAAAFARRFDIPAAYEDPEEMLDTEKLDAVTVVTPDQHHAEPAILSLRKGLHVLCEKPLAFTLKDAQRMAREAARRPDQITAVNFSYRNSPATQKAAELVRSGRLGPIRHVAGRYLQGWLATMFDDEDWKNQPHRLWRLSTAHGSNGVLGDLGVHLYDLARFVVGDFGEVLCDLHCFDKTPDRCGEYVFDANDTALTTVRFADGAAGVLHTTRWAAGHANTVAIRVHGEEGALDLDLDRGPEALRVCLGKANLQMRRWKVQRCRKTPHMYQRFVTAIRRGEPCQTSFAGGLEIQKYIEKSLESAKKGRFLKV
jgi:predicted dehydrogenase